VVLLHAGSIPVRHPNCVESRVDRGPEMAGRHHEAYIHAGLGFDSYTVH
jgi:hypothetical protein